MNIVLVCVGTYLFGLVTGYLINQVKHKDVISHMNDTLLDKQKVVESLQHYVENNIKEKLDLLDKIDKESKKKSAPSVPPRVDNTKRRPITASDIKDAPKRPVRKAKPKKATRKKNEN